MLNYVIINGGLLRSKTTMLLCHFVCLTTQIQDYSIPIAGFDKPHYPGMHHDASWQPPCSLIYSSPAEFSQKESSPLTWNRMASQCLFERYPAQITDSLPPPASRYRENPDTCNDPKSNWIRVEPLHWKKHAQLNPPSESTSNHNHPPLPSIAHGSLSAHPSSFTMAPSASFFQAPGLRLFALALGALLSAILSSRWWQRVRFTSNFTLAASVTPAFQTNIKEIGISKTCGYNSSFKGHSESKTRWWFGDWLTSRFEGRAFKFDFEEICSAMLNSSQFQLPASISSIWWLIVPANHDASWKRTAGESNLWIFTQLKWSKQVVAFCKPCCSSVYHEHPPEPKISSERIMSNNQ